MSPVASALDGGDRRAEVVPPEILPLFGDRFILSCDLFEEYVRRLAWKIARQLGPREGLDPSRAPAMLRWLDGTLATAEASRDRDPGEIEQAQASHDASCLPSYAIARLASELYVPVVRGEADGETALFGPDRVGAWRDYFANDNPLYAVGNRIAAVALDAALPAEGGAVLELGGGFGSAADAALDRIAPRARSYRLTDVVAAFLRPASRALAARFSRAPVSCGRLDMNAAFAEAGVEPGSMACVYAVNAVHAARDLPFTLREIRRALAPGGTLVLGECVRPFPGRPVPVEIVFNALDAFRAAGGFLTPERWTAVLVAAGFRDVRVYPDISRIRAHYPAFYSAAITGAAP